LQQMTRTVFQILAFTVPIVVFNSALQGFLGAFQRFDLITAVRIPTSATVFLSPLLVLPFSHSLPLIVLLLLVTRAMAGFAYFALCAQQWPDLLNEFEDGHAYWHPLISYGGWILVTNSLAPLMLYCDRFFVGALLSVSAVAYYVTPYELIT